MTAERFAEKITESYAAFTKAEKAVAAYLLDNQSSVPFETLSTIARTCNVSDMTVSRFIRTLGYRNLSEIKAELHKEATLSEMDVDDISKRRASYFTDEIGLRSSLEKEIKSICEVYALSETAIWQESVALIAYRPTVQVIGFQSAMGLALDFSTSLKYIRPGVRYLDDCSGIFLDLFECDPKETCLVVVDTALYAEASRQLIALAAEKSYPIVMISDKYSFWGLDYTKYLLRASSETNTYSDSRVAISAITNLLQHFVAHELKDQTAARGEQSSALNAYFNAFSE